MIALNISISVLAVSFLPLSFVLVLSVIPYTNTAIDFTGILSNSERVTLTVAVPSLLQIIPLVWGKTGNLS